MGNFNDMLKYLRVREKMSQAELADKLGVSKSTVGMYELGKESLILKRLKRSLIYLM